MSNLLPAPACVRALQSRFRLGEMEDAAETLATILRVLHEECLRESGAYAQAVADRAAALARLQAAAAAAGTPADPAEVAKLSKPVDCEDLPCTPPCPAHACFGYQYCAFLRCLACRSNQSDPMPAMEMMYYVTEQEVGLRWSCIVHISSSWSAGGGATHNHARVGVRCPSPSPLLVLLLLLVCLAGAVPTHHHWYGYGHGLAAPPVAASCHHRLYDPLPHPTTAAVPGPGAHASVRRHRAEPDAGAGGRRGGGAADASFRRWRRVCAASSCNHGTALDQPSPIIMLYHFHAGSAGKPRS